jgi:hypothetical protein
MWWPDLSLFYTGCTQEHILQNNTIKRFLAIFWRLTFSGHILTRLSLVLEHHLRHSCAQPCYLIQISTESFNLKLNQKSYYITEKTVNPV